jgi:hypothetical protein
MKKEEILIEYEEKANKVAEVLKEKASEKPNPNIDEIKEKLRAGNSALNRARILHDVGDFPGSIMALQLSSELFSKALSSCLISSSYTDDQKLISHKMVNLYANIIDSNFVSDIISFAKEVNPKIKTDTNELKKLNSIQNQEEIRNYSYEQIKIPFDVCEQMEKSIQNNEEISSSGLLELYNLGISLCRLYIISVILSPHQQTTKYTNDKIKPWNYDENMGVVKAIPLFIEMLIKSNKELEGIVKTYEELEE